MSSKLPIGIFDSGIGGLTVANAISKLMPNEKIIYFGDTVHFPYGDKSPQSIRNYCARITKFLLAKKCKLIVIACNTASSHGCNTVIKLTVTPAMVVNVIDPVAQYVAKHHSKQKVGVIATKGTINSRIYVRRIQKLDPKITVAQLATPLLAPMIEEGFFNNYISKTIINSYLEKRSLQNIKGLILGCTHYPLIKKEVENYYKKGVEVIDSASIVAQSVRRRLMDLNLTANRKSLPNHQFFVSDYTADFDNSTRYFFKDKIQLKKHKLWTE